MDLLFVDGAMTSVNRSIDPNDYQDVPQPVSAMAKEFADGTRVLSHKHKRGQLLYAISGVMRVTTPARAWTVPPLRALWIPPETSHEIVMVGRVAMRTLYVEPGLATEFWTECRVLEVAGLLRELILKLLEEPTNCRPNERGVLMTELVLHELRSAPTAPVQLPMPRDSRLLKICQALIEHPESDETLESWAERAGASARTVARHFRAETGLSFGTWRQRLRLAESMSRLVAGDSITQVADRLGYRSASAFVAMFRRALGETPNRYLRASTAPAVAPIILPAAPVGRNDCEGGRIDSRPTTLPRPDYADRVAWKKASSGVR